MKIIFHVDVNSAFLSWSAVKRLKEDPSALDLRTVPSAVGGDVKTRHGVITAKSIPAKRFGITTGEPVMTALRKCPDLILIPSDFQTYRQYSKAFIRILKQHSALVEQVSIDEAFADMTDIPDPLEEAAALRAEIREKLQFTVNVGISENKLLAKMASDFEKPNKVHTLFPYEIEKKMYPLPIGDLYLVGRKMKDAFLKAGVRTIKDLSKLEISDIQKIAGNKMGEVYYDFIHGIDESPVISNPHVAKSYSISRTFEHDITTKDRAYAILLLLTDEVASRMREDDKEARVISVVIRNNKFEDSRKQLTLGEETDSTTEIYELAKELFDILWDGKEPLRLLGVGLSGITNAISSDNENNDAVSQEESMTMIEYLESLMGRGKEDASSEEDKAKIKNKKIDRAIDELRKKFGYDIVSRGSILKEIYEEDD